MFFFRIDDVMSLPPACITLSTSARFTLTPSGFARLCRYPTKDSSAPIHNIQPVIQKLKLHEMHVVFVTIFIAHQHANARYRYGNAVRLSDFGLVSRRLYVSSKLLITSYEYRSSLGAMRICIVRTDCLSAAGWLSVTAGIVSKRLNLS